MTTSDPMQRLHEMAWFASRGRERRYVLSEHVVRALMGGEVPLADIEIALQTGRIVEERRHLRRGVSFLVAARSGDRFVHLVCAEVDGLAVVLFAYRPRPPVWENALRRAPVREDEMIESFNACFFCGGSLKRITVGNFDYRLDGRLYVVKRVPARLCLECGEKYIDPDVGHRLNALIADQAFTASEQVGVIDYR